MKVTPEKNEKVVKIIFGSIYPLYLNRLEKNERTQKEFNQVIEWLTGFDEQNIQQLVKENISFASFFENANIHPKAHLITGMICGCRIERISKEFSVYRTFAASINW